MDEKLVGRIKTEPTERSDGVIPGNADNRKVLVEVGMSRRKVFLLDNTNSLSDQFNMYACSDRALSSLLNNSYPVFQEFNTKFDTWVDIDGEENLRDGAVLRVMFFAKAIETSSSNPKSLQQKRVYCANSGQMSKQCCILHDNIEINSSSMSGKKNAAVIFQPKETNNSCCHNNMPERCIPKENLQLHNSILVPEKSNIKICGSAANDLLVNSQDSELPPSQQESAQEYEQLVEQGCIFENTSQERKSWARRNAKEHWRTTLYSGIAHFVLKENSIQYHENHCSSENSQVVFWSCNSFDGPNIIYAVDSPLTSDKLAKILEKNIIQNYKNRSVTLRCKNTLPQYKSKLVKTLLKTNSIDILEWSVSDKDPLHHAWKNVADKVKNMHCSSKEEMISIITEEWINNWSVNNTCKKTSIAVYLQ